MASLKCRIRSIACVPGCWMFTAKAEGDIAVHSQEGAQLDTARAHEGGALALCTLPHAGRTGVDTTEDGDDRQQDAACMMMSGGQDCAVKIWRVSDSGSLAPVLRYACRSSVQVNTACVLPSIRYLLWA